MMQCGKDPAGTFKTMAEDSNRFKQTLNSGDTENTPTSDSRDNVVTRRLSFLSENGMTTLDEPTKTCTVLTVQNVSDETDSYRYSAEIAGRFSPQTVNTCLNAKNTIELYNDSSETVLISCQDSMNSTDDKENTALTSSSSTPGKQPDLHDVLLFPLT